MSTPSRPTLPFASNEGHEPSLREVLASLGIETTAEEQKRKRREAAARRCATRDKLPTLSGTVARPIHSGG